MKKMRWIILVLVGILLAGGILACAGESAPAPTPAPAAPTTKPTSTPAPTTPPTTPKVKIVNISTASGIESIGYAGIVAAGGGIKKTTGMEIKAFSVPGDIDSMTALKDGSSDIVMPGSATTQTAFRGLSLFKKAGWEPMKELRQVFTIYWTDVGIAVPDNSSIKSFTDLKGKRMATAPNSASATAALKCLAAFLDADYEKDFEHVQAASYSAMINYVKDGMADFAFSSVSSAGAREAAASPDGLRWIGFPVEDKVGLQRWYDAWDYPAYGMVPIPEGGGVNIPSDGLWGYGSPYTWVTLQERDADLIYEVAKGASFGYQYFRDATPTTWQASLTNNASVDFVQPDIPFHEGVVRWYKEIGVWTPALEAEQARRLKAVGATK